MILQGSWPDKPTPCRSSIPIKALRELGRVVRTVTLLRYLSESELRDQITAITNHTEAFHGFAAHLMIGGRLIGHNDPDYQERVVKFDELIANCAVHSTALDTTDAANALTAEGHAVDPDDLATRQPADRAHDTPLRRLALGPHPAQGCHRHQVGTGSRSAVSHRAGVKPRSAEDLRPAHAS
ncbi:transposase [Streptomyces europaeiscabiei]|uniref:Tn3 family transposase n=1 Tax=Streptomyces europaeiscabiei TaxID=146819 RepID=UPI002E82262D|nr:Tn3 family transposase [Streptomyces europaeiscabiei]WUD34990.1 transposase [Streptomyces europaeiscabiei]